MQHRPAKPLGSAMQALEVGSHEHPPTEPLQVVHLDLADARHAPGVAPPLTQAAVKSLQQPARSLRHRLSQKQPPVAYEPQLPTQESGPPLLLPQTLAKSVQQSPMLLHWLSQ